MTEPTIITCALTGGGDTTGKSPAVPVTPQQIADQAIGAAEAGAAIVHVHVRDPGTGAGSVEYDLYAEVVERIRSSSVDVVINLTSGPGCFYRREGYNLVPATAINPAMTPDDRIRHIIGLKPEICSLDIGAVIYGNLAAVNFENDLAYMAEKVAEVGVVPELEVFELGHVRLAGHMLGKGSLCAPGYFQFCLGVPWGAPANAEAISLMKSLLPAGANWSAFAIGRDQFPIAAEAVRQGGHLRVGLEDNLYISHGKLAADNAELVAEASRIVKDLGSRPATPDEARSLLGLRPR